MFQFLNFSILMNHGISRSVSQTYDILLPLNEEVPIPLLLIQLGDKIVTCFNF